MYSNGNSFTFGGIANGNSHGVSSETLLPSMEPVLIYPDPWKRMP
jgi:hypothetical protein